MSTSTATQTFSSAQVLEAAFLRRVNKGDDSGAVALLDELFEEIRTSDSPKDILITGCKAVDLWSALPTDAILQKTRDKLWGTALGGLLVHPSDRTADEYAKITSFIGSVFGPNERFNELRIARLKEKLDAAHQDRACTEVMNFLKTADMSKSSFTSDMLLAVSKMFGRYAEPAYLMLCAHIYSALKAAANSIRGLDRSYTLRLVSPYMAEMVVRAARMAQVAESLRLSFTDNPQPALVNRDSGKLGISFDWESSADDAGSADEVARSKAFLAEQAMRVASWRTKNPGAPSFEVVLTTTVRSTKPNGGLSCTFHPIVD